MRTRINVARYHLMNPVSFVAGPWAFLAFVFFVNLIITALQGGPNPTKALAGIYAVFFVVGVLSIARSLPFGLALGVSRRSYYTGTAGLAVCLAALYGLVLSVLGVIERATGGWGVQMHFFDVSYLFAGAWYTTWATSFVGLVLLFVYGMWFGIVYRRWDVTGLVTFIAAQAVVLAGGASAATGAGAWGSIGHFFTVLTAPGLTGVGAGVAGALLAGGYTAIRHVTV